ncbi:Lrp/AsnC family transcriptional regulator [Parapedobacter sp. GCM10030251]|jgi:Transcriptional regulators|uniref:Lrp/AsnC family transcriptional regulator n=1 Tax=Parapedobacter sp. GCM10030251 TaxID=3273419 RepID=UPI00361BE1EA
MAILDPIDLELLRILQRDNSLTNKELGDRLHRSPTAIQERRRKLLEQGYIKRSVVILDKLKIDRTLTVFAHVFLKEHSAEALDRFEQEVTAFPEVMECLQMAGNLDFILRIVTRDMEGYNRLLRERIATLSNIATIQSFFVLREPKSDTAYPI